MHKTIAVVVAVLVGVLIVAANGFAPVASADPADEPCQGVVSLICHFVPMAPDLDGDVDLTKQQPDGNSAVVAPEPAPVDPCVHGCI